MFLSKTLYLLISKLSFLEVESPSDGLADNKDNEQDVDPAVVEKPNIEESMNFDPDLHYDIEKVCILFY